MAKYKITFKQFLKFCKQNGHVIPTWLDETIFKEALQVMEAQGKLHVCKFILDKSKENNTREQFDLKWSKIAVADVLELYRVLPVTSKDANSVTVNVEELLRVLEPFRAMANECLYNSTLHHDQTVYAYNKAQITMENLRDVEKLVNDLKNLK